MNKERLGSLPEEAGETTPDEQLKRETEMLELMAETTPFGYPPHSLQDDASRYSKSIRDRTHER